MKDYMSVALKAVEEAGAVLLEYYQRLSELKAELKNPNDYVTEADTASEMVIVETIKSSFPDHTIVAEESGVFEKEEKFRWYIDPLDGTKNFIQGLQMFSISVALEVSGELVVGVVHAPVLNETFTAEKGSGAYLNGERIRVSNRSFETAMIATGFPFRAKEFLDDYLKSFREIFLSVSAVRRCGSAALDLAYTARGIFDGFWEMALSPWDISAGVLLIEEAGGKVSDFKGGRNFLKSGNIVGASPNVYPKLFEIVNKTLGRYEK